jgi:hypothetical protein
MVEAATLFMLAFFPRHAGTGKRIRSARSRDQTTRGVIPRAPAAMIAGEASGQVLTSAAACG